MTSMNNTTGNTGTTITAAGQLTEIQIGWGEDTRCTVCLCDLEAGTPAWQDSEATLCNGCAETEGVVSDISGELDLAAWIGAKIRKANERKRLDAAEDGWIAARIRKAAERIVAGDGRTSNCRACGEPITMLGGDWTDSDGGTCCYADLSAPYVPHKPAGE